MPWLEVALAGAVDPDEPHWIDARDNAALAAELWRELGPDHTLYRAKWTLDAQWSASDDRARHLRRSGRDRPSDLVAIGS